MPTLSYPHPSFNGYGSPPTLYRVLDPEEINANFAAIQKLVNGNLGLENLAGGTGITTGMLAAARSLTCLSFQLNTSLASWPADRIIVRMKSAGRMRGVSVYGASSASLATGFLAQLKVNAAVAATIDAPRPLKSLYEFNLITAPSFAANDDIKINVTRGSINGTLGLWCTFGHSA